MLTELANEISNFIEESKHHIPLVLKWLAGLWGINLLNWKMGGKLNYLGIYPRHVLGLPGILFAPILHANFTHLLFNTVPLFFLALFVMTMSLKIFYIVTAMVVVLSGFSVWCIGRPGIHLGASGLIAGYFGFILANAYEKPTFAALFCAVVALYYFGGILLSLLPSEEKTSWEGHLTGLLSGVLSSVLIQGWR